MDPYPRQTLCDWLLQPGQTKRLARLPGDDVVMIYAAHFRDAAAPPLELTDTIRGVLSVHRTCYVLERDYDIVAFFNLLVTLRISRLVSPDRDALLHDIQVDRHVSVRSFVAPPPLPITRGHFQYIFHVNGVQRGVAEVGDRSRCDLTARCIVGMELLAAQADVDGPVFGIAFTGYAWTILELSTGATGRHIRRYHGAFNRHRDDDVALFLGAVRVVFKHALDA